MRVDQVSDIQTGVTQSDNLNLDSQGLLARLSRIISGLPETVAIGLPSDILAGFRGRPQDLLDPDDEPWEVIDKTLNRVIGFGATKEDVMGIIRRGEYGMDAMFGWLEACIRDLRVDEGLLEGKVNRLIDAMISLGAIEKGIRNTSLASCTKLNVPKHRPTQGPTTDDKEEPLRSTRDSHVSPPCRGYHLQVTTSEATSAIVYYPFYLHAKQTLPWSVITAGNELYLKSNNCLKESKRKGDNDIPCIACRQLHDHSIVTGIRHRALDGANERTPWKFLGPIHMYASLEKKTEQLRRSRLKILNTLRTLAVRNRHIDAWKRLSMSISQENIPRIRALLTSAHRAGSSVFAIIDKVSKAARRIYQIQGYNNTDYQLMFLLYKIGGRAAANIAHRALGLPSIDTAKRHVTTAPLMSSPKFPTPNELQSNLKFCYPNAEASTRMMDAERRAVKGMSMQVDEIKVQERLRWEPRTNSILGVCREHGGQCSLDFRSMHQADTLLDCLRSKTVHLATEATVIGTSVFSASPKEYTTKVIAISGSCKQELVADQEKLLKTAASEITTHLRNTIPSRRLYCLASDGDARRRRALIAITMHRELDPSSPVGHSLANLPLFNLKCGDDDITSDFDWKHVLKRFRNTLLRQKGIIVNDLSITTAVLKAHLVSAGMNSITADTLLAPNDRQDVVLMVKLLHALSLLPAPETTDSPLRQNTRRVLCLLGRIYACLLKTYMDVSLSLNEQLVQLSTAAHLILAIYHTDKGNFIPVQTYFDVMSMIKNAYFCVAKAQTDDPDGEFWLILLGTDGLEKVFGQVRTIVGNDTNADQLQLTNRIDGAVQCNNILEDHPELGGQPRRLTVKPLPSDPTHISSVYDHISPKSWKGDVHVKNVTLDGCWSEGRRLAEKYLNEAGIDPPFTTMEKDGEYDIFCPFGQGRMVLAGGELLAGEREESEEEREGGEDVTQVAPSPDVTVTLPTQERQVGNITGQPTSAGTNEAPILEPTEDRTHAAAVDDELEVLQPDFEDAADIADVESTSAIPSYEPWVLVDNKKVHKATVMRLYSDPFSFAISKDRLKRVRNFTQYNETVARSGAPQPITDIDNPNVVCVQDPAITVVRCSKQVFLAVVQITAIRHNQADVQWLDVKYLHEPNVSISGQIMKLALTTTANHQPDTPDWEWIGLFEAGSLFHSISGRFFELIDPALHLASRGRNVGKQTYAFFTPELRAMAAVLYQRVGEDITKLVEVPQTPTFPYRSAEDNVDGDAAREMDLDSCRICRFSGLSKLTAPALVTHMSAHILHDERMKGEDSPCGFCLNTGNLCRIVLNVTSKRTLIDVKASTCPNLRRLTIKIAAQFSKENSPCTNHPLICPLCPPKSPAVWKYNMRHHLAVVEKADPNLYKEYWEICEEEKVLMKGQLKVVPRKSKKSKVVDVIPTSDAHSSRLALRENGVDEVPEEESEEETEEEVEEGVEERAQEEGESNSMAQADEREQEPIATGSDLPLRTSMANELPLLSRPRKRRGAPTENVDMDAEIHECADDGCGGVINDSDFLKCDAPGCDLTVSSIEFLKVARHPVNSTHLVSLIMSRPLDKTNWRVVLRRRLQEKRGISCGEQKATKEECVAAM
ncbi:hypothetical protein D9613_011212 [Agrocybe pediades]|uniref:Uncharacterized protein n=1 Tax=Agrocybe pediades TaxID=84607 RepID=A0A8H4QRC3_9AGAR|nr:hypothetical protein D9613_011212 [Agrocybe pediades]